jgi:hypothetical protein
VSSAAEAGIEASADLRRVTRRWTNALLEGDEAFVHRLVSEHPVALFVGTDDAEWAEGHDDIVRALARRMRGLRPTRLLETSVFLLEHGEWRLVQHHASVGA